MTGIHFYNVVWQSESGLVDSTIEAATSRRWLVDHIRTGDVKPIHLTNAKMLKVQEFETPIIDYAWLVKMLQTGGTKQDREDHAAEASYVLNLVAKLGARVKYTDDETGEERLVER